MAYLDLETTRSGDIVEISILRMEANNAPVGLSTRVDPGVSSSLIHREMFNTRIHGIQPSDVRGAPLLTDLCPRICALLTDVTIVAHNASFDRKILVRHLQDRGYRTAAPWMCSLRLARALLPDLAGGYGLQSLANTFGLHNPAPHTAAGDVVTLVAVVSSIITFVAATDGGPQRIGTAMRRSVLG